METKAVVTEEIISHFPANISEPDSSVSDEQPLVRFSLSIPSIFPATISEFDQNSTVSAERLPQFCPSINSIFSTATSTQTNSPENDEIIPYHHPTNIDSCFPPRCDSDSFVVSYDINTINRYWRSFSIQSYFPSFRSSSVSSVYDHPSRSISSFNLKEFNFADLKTATKNFRLDSVLGEGGFGMVFKGWMDEKTLSPSKVGNRKSTMLVAVKRLRPESFQSSEQ